MRFRCDQLRGWWQRVQMLGSHGRYSVERMTALREYSAHTSRWRVALVHVLSITPAVISIVILDALPLQDPSAGWSKNTTMWTRVMLSTFLLTFGVMLELRTLVPAAMLTIVQCTSVSIAAATSFTGVSMLIASVWTFPMPFMMVLGNVPWALALYGGAFAAIGKHKLAAIPEIKVQFKRFKGYMDVVSTFIIVYSAYGAVFRSLDGVRQFAFLLVLPVVKYVLKKVTIAVVADVEDIVFAVAISVDMFNALFQAKCMQNSGSFWTTVGIIALDAVQNVYSLWRLFHGAGDFHALIQSGFSTRDVLSICTDSMQTPELLDLTDFRIESWNPVELSSESVALLRAIHMEQSNQRSKRRPSGSVERSNSLRAPEIVSSSATTGVTSNTVLPWPLAPIRTTAVVPVSSSSLGTSRIVPVPKVAFASSHSMTKAQRTAVLKKTLELLWKCDRVLLVEYVESAIPLVYATSLAILYYLPNAKYYPGMADMTPEKLRSTIVSILIYSALEFLSLIYLNAILHWCYNLSALHQLAFVLSTERHVIQGAFVGWTIAVLSFTLVHYGAFIFRLNSCK